MLQLYTITFSSFAYTYASKYSAFNYEVIFALKGRSPSPSFSSHSDHPVFLARKDRSHQYGLMMDTPSCQPFLPNILGYRIPSINVHQSNHLNTEMKPPKYLIVIITSLFQHHMFEGNNNGYQFK